MLNAMTDYFAFVLAMGVAVIAGTKLLPMAEVLLMEDLPEDGTNEA
jgi:hypothetical protein